MCLSILAHNLHLSLEIMRPNHMLHTKKSVKNRTKARSELIF